MTSNTTRNLMTPEDIERTLKKLAAQIWDQMGSDKLALVGIRRRGATLAKRLQPTLCSLAGYNIPLGILDIGLYRDDIGMGEVAPEVRSTEINFDIDGKDIILVDDVLYTGRTIRAALNALMDLGRPAHVKLLVLIDRGNRELPIQADFAGNALDTHQNETVSVLLREDDGEEAVQISSNE